MHEKNCFITLTYNDQNLPGDMSVNKKEVQKFFKRLRKDGLEFRYFACGEYGDLSKRPHYHAILFGIDFDDKVLHTVDNGNPIYKSEYLEKKWGKGFCTIGDCTFQSCAYVARYVMKKFKNDKRDPEKINKHYTYDYGEKGIIQVEPEFCLQSRGKGGIGTDWYKRYKKTDCEKDFITLDGKKMSLPKFYDYLLEKENPKKLSKVKAIRKNNIDPEEQTQKRLRAKEAIKKAQLQFLERNLQ